MTPPQLTPKSWSKTGGSSLSGGAGQMGTKVLHKGRGAVIAGVAALVVCAGIGGFFIAGAMKGETKAAAKTEESEPAKHEDIKVNMSAQPAAGTPEVDATSGAAKVDTPAKTDATKSAVKTDATKTDAVKTDATKTDATKTASKSSSTKTANKTSSKSSSTKTHTTKTTKTEKTGDDLFDDRK